MIKNITSLHIDFTSDELHQEWSLNTLAHEMSVEEEILKSFAKELAELLAKYYQEEWGSDSNAVVTVTDTTESSEKILTLKFDELLTNGK